MADTDLLFKIIAQDEYKAKLQEAQALVDKMTVAEKEQAAATGQQAAAERDLASAAQESKGAISDVRTAINESLVGIQAGIGLAGEAIGAFKKVWDFTQEGAALERIQTQFENMAASAGVNADNLLKSLDKAAHGTVDDEALMQTATRAFALGLTNNANALTKLMEIARASSVAFGGDTASAFERISTAVENLTPRSLKQAGIIVDLNKAYKDYATQLGTTADKLTDEEKRQALLNQVLDKGSELVAKIGNQAEDTATKMARFQTKVADLFEELKKAAAQGATPLIDQFNVLNVAFDQNATNADKLRAAYELMVDQGFFQSKEAADQAKQAIDILSRAEQDNGDSLDFATRHAQEYVTQLQQLAQAQKDATQGAYGQAGALDESNRAITRTYEANRNASINAAAAVAAQAAETQNAIKAHDAYMVSLGNEIKANETLAQSLKNATTEQAKQTLAKVALETLKEAYDKNVIGAKGLEDAVKAVELQYGLATPQSIAMADAQSKLNDAFISGQLPLNTYVQDIGKIPQIAADGTVTTQELSRLGIQPLSNDFATAREKVEEFITSLNRIPGSITTTINVTPTTTPAPPTETPIRTYPLLGGAQAGANFIVPPNPKGGSGDYYPVLAAPGEHVSIAPNGGAAGGGGTYNINLSVGGTNVSPDEILNLVYEGITRVNNEATR